jgi:hypothetical protein
MLCPINIGSFGAITRLLHCKKIDEEKPYYQRPYLWHSRASGGAVDSIITGSHKAC